MNLTANIVGRKIDSKWEGATIINGKFSRAYTHSVLAKLLCDNITQLIPAGLPEGTDFVISINVTEPGTVDAQG